MADRLFNVALSQEDLTLIESALHTQAKILNVQASAGGSDARTRLKQVQHVLETITGHREHEDASGLDLGPGWFGMQRNTG